MNFRFLDMLAALRLRHLIAPLLLLPSLLWSHPIPDVPVRASFKTGGACAIRIDVDPRTFEEDPNTATYLTKAQMEHLTPNERQEMMEEAAAFIQKTVTLEFSPLGTIAPDWEFKFTGLDQTTPKEAEDSIVIQASWNTTVPSGIEGYRIKALPEGKLSVLFLNEVNGREVERIAVLFPGETSFLLDLSELRGIVPTGPAAGAISIHANNAGRWATFVDFLREGFRHVVPLGLDHILFVLGVFLLSRKWKPLLWQVSTFTVAHTLTLGLATMGYVHVPAAIVEPIIAGSIAVVALENIFHPRYTRWRLIIVFVFGLIHGLGFAGALTALDLPTASLITGLVGFNIGVEGGQLAVIALAFLATAWIRNPGLYRTFIVIPGSLAIAVMGVMWMIQRI